MSTTSHDTRDHPPVVYRLSRKPPDSAFIVLMRRVERERPTLAGAITLFATKCLQRQKVGA
jgi:hypothetical protein